MLQIAHAITNPDRSFAEADEAYCEMLQLTPAELRRRDILDITHPADRAQNEASLHQVIDQGIPFWIRKRYVRDDGSLVWVLNHVTRVVGIAGATRLAATSFNLPPETLSRYANQGAEHLETQTDMLRKLL